jgi:hypothetical protein
MPARRLLPRLQSVSEVDTDGAVVRCLVTGTFQPFLEALRGYEVLARQSTPAIDGGRRFLVVHNMATTAHNIQAHELLYRLGLAAHVVVTVTNIPMALLFYELLKVVNRRLALLDVFFSLVATAVEAASLLSQFTPVVLLGSRHYASALPPAQLHALAYLPGDLATTDYLA